MSFSCEYSSFALTLKMKTILCSLLLLACIGISMQSDPTSCTHHAERESRSKVPGRVIPKCDKDGNYLPLQCHGQDGDKIRFCQCWDKKGNIVKGPSKLLKACDCILKKHETPAIPGAYIPSCEADGTFSKLQSHGSTGMSWCSAPDGRELTLRKRESVKCD